MKKSIYLFLLLLLACSNDHPDDDPAGNENPVPDIPLTIVTLDTNDKRQIMDGVGANCWTFPYANDVGWNWNSTKFVFDELDIRYIRIAPWFVFWEENNDNENPDSINWNGFNQRGISTNHDLGLAQYAASKGVEIELGIWSVGEWLLKARDPNIVDPLLYSELGESIVSYILFMKENGVDIRVTEVQNEPNIAAGNIYESPENHRDAALAIIAQLDNHGLTEVMLHSPNLATPDETGEWGSPVFSDPILNERTIAVSYHTWWVDDFNSYDAIRSFAENAAKPVWATEVGYCALSTGCFGGTHFLKPETWATAWDYAMSYYRAIDWSRASRIYHWSLLGHDAVVSPAGIKYPSFYILKHFADFIPEGAVYIGSDGSDNLLSMAFEFPGGTHSVIVVNAGATDKFIMIEGTITSTISEAVQTTKSGYYKTLEIIKNKDGESGFLLPAQSVSSFLTE